MPSHRLQVFETSPPESKNRIYFHCDGSLVEKEKRYGSWGVIGKRWNADSEQWDEIYKASASHVPATCSGQMELRALNNALHTGIRQYPGTVPALSTPMWKDYAGK